jgi:hypothetical protein
MSVTVTVGTPPHGPDPRRVRVGLLKLNEITRLVITEADDDDDDGGGKAGEEEEEAEGDAKVSPGGHCNGRKGDTMICDRCCLPVCVVWLSVSGAGGRCRGAAQRGLLVGGPQRRGEDRRDSPQSQPQPQREQRCPGPRRRPRRGGVGLGL